MSLVDSRSDKIDNRDVVSGLAAGAKAVTEHEAQGGFEHRFIRLLKAGFLVEGNYGSDHPE